MTNISNETYNGWTNRETWLAILHIDNDQEAQSNWRVEAEEIWENAEADEHFTRYENAWLYLAEKLEEQFDFCVPSSIEGKGMYSLLASDLLNTAIGQVEWREIAMHMIDAVKEESEAA